MNLDRINGWLTVLTNVAVVLGLLIVAYEVSQNNEAISVEIESVENEIAFNSFQSISSFYQNIASDEDFARIWIGGNAGILNSDIDKERYSRMTWTWYQSFFQTWAAWDSREQGAGDFVIQQIGRDALGNSGLVETIQRNIDLAPESRFHIQLRELLNEQQ